MARPSSAGIGACIRRTLAVLAWSFSLLAGLGGGQGDRGEPRRRRRDQRRQGPAKKALDEDQAASLVKINALLKGKLSKEETIKLAITSLNISVSALKRTKEIADAREDAAKSRLADLAAYRRQLRDDLLKEDVA